MDCLKIGKIDINQINEIAFVDDLKDMFNRPAIKSDE